MKSSTRATRWLILGLVLLLAVACLPLSNSEIRSFLQFKTAPAQARDAHFLRLKGRDQTVYLLGTIHKDHRTSKAYSLWHIEAVIEHLKPDLLLVESRPEELTKDNWGDGPIEMPFASLMARQFSIPVDGIDWWQKAGSKPGTSNTEREERMFQNVQKRLAGHRTVLVMIGYSHIAELQSRLEKVGYTLDRFDVADKHALFSIEGRPEKFPPGMKRYLQKYIDAARADAERETDAAWKLAIETNLAVREGLLRLVDEVGERAPAEDAK
jgi:hypothetical protein